jgi:uncharacterized protein
MISALSEQEIEQLLKSQVIGRIGCYDGGKSYVVPISYAYDANNIYAHTTEGLKVAIMRRNPEICFQVDNLQNMARWQSVIAWGRFEELKNRADRSRALKILVNRRLPIVSSATTHLGADWPFLSDNINDLEGVVFRIAISRKTGRFER